MIRPSASSASRFGTELARLDPAHVEQVPDQDVESFGFRVDRAGGFPSLLVGPRHLRIEQAPGRGPDARQRRAKSVRHGVEQRALQRFTLAGDLGLVGGLDQSLAAERQPDLVRGEAQDPRLLAIGVALRADPCGPDRPDRLVAGCDDDPIQADARRWRVRSRTLLRAMLLDPTRRQIARRPREGDVDPVGRERSAAGVGHDHVATRLAPGEPDAFHARLGQKVFDDDRQCVGHARRRGQGAADAEECAGFGSAPGRVVRAFGLEGRQAADDDADEQQQEQIQPLLRIVHGQREPRFDEEGVVQQERGERGHDRCARPEDDGDADDGDEVERRRVRDLERRAFDQRDEQRRQRQQGDRQQPDRQASGSEIPRAGQPGQMGSERVREHVPMLRQPFPERLP